MLYNIHHGLSKCHLEVLQLDEFIDMVVYFNFSSMAGDRFSKKYFVCRRQRCKELSINFQTLLFFKKSKHSTTNNYWIFTASLNFFHFTMVLLLTFVTPFYICLKYYSFLRFYRFLEALYWSLCHHIEQPLDFWYRP